MNCARRRSVTLAIGSRMPCARRGGPMPAHGAIYVRWWRGGLLMDDRMRRIEPSDLSMWKNMSRTMASSDDSDWEETTATPEEVCPTCKGAGYYTLDVRVSDPNFGVLMTCHCK